MAREVKMQRVRVLRAFFVGGKPTAAGEEVSLPSSLAIYLQAARKVDFIDPEPEAPSEQKSAAAPSEPAATAAPAQTGRGKRK